MKIRNPGYLVILAILIIYAILYAPGNNTENVLLIQRMYSDFRSVNPLIFSTFNLLGVWTMVYAVLVLEEAESQSFSVWPFILLSFFMGGFSYLVYFSIRTPVFEKSEKTKLQKRIEKRQNMVILFLVGLFLVIYGIVYGDWVAFVESFWTSGLVHIMSIDFLLISVLFPSFMKDDMIRRDDYSLSELSILSVFSVIGALFYLNKRVSK